jgi:CheY-like chemotaxis protein
MARHEPLPGTGERPRTILVVEDELLIRLAIADDLRQAGFLVVEARNADEALDYLACAEAPDLVFTDVQMPGSVNGIGLALRIADLAPSIRLLVTSAYRCPDLSVKFSFIPKPYLHTVVIDRICAALASE